MSSISLKILPVFSLVSALSPLVAQAHLAAAPQTVHVSPIMPGSTTVDDPTPLHGSVDLNSDPAFFEGYAHLFQSSAQAGCSQLDGF